MKKMLLVIVSLLVVGQISQARVDSCFEGLEQGLITKANAEGWGFEGLRSIGADEAADLIQTAYEDMTSDREKARAMREL